MIKNYQYKIVLFVTQNRVKAFTARNSVVFGKLQIPLPLLLDRFKWESSEYKGKNCAAEAVDVSSLPAIPENNIQYTQPQIRTFFRPPESIMDFCIQWVTINLNLASKLFHHVTVLCNDVINISPCWHGIIGVYSVPGHRFRVKIL